MKQSSILLLTLGFFFSYKATFGQDIYPYVPTSESLVITGSNSDLEVFNSLSGIGLMKGSLASCAWLSTGNDNISPSDRLGTINDEPLRIVTGDIERLRITTTGRLVFHNDSPLSINPYENLYLGGGNETPHVNAVNNSANTVVGMRSLSTNTRGYKNTVVGYKTLSKNTIGHQNTVLGSNSMNNSTAGAYNVIVGSNSMNENVTGFMNVAIGNRALSNNTSGSNNISIGYNSGKNLTTGSNNIFIGNGSLGLQEEENEELGIIVPISPTTSNQLNIGNWIFGYNGQIAIGEFDDLAEAFELNEVEGYQLLVKKGIRTEKVRVDVSDLNNWADYVFEDDYKLVSLSELDNIYQEK